MLRLVSEFASREPLRVIGEVVDWQGHSPEELKAMKDGLEWLRQQGVEPIDSRSEGALAYQYIEQKGPAGMMRQVGAAMACSSCAPRWMDRPGPARRCAFSSRLCAR